MPVYQHFKCHFTNAQIGIWQLVEPIEVLTALAQNNNIPAPPPLTHAHPKRHLEWYAPRLLLTHLLPNTNAGIAYRQPKHQPYITSPQTFTIEEAQSHCISISHTRYAAAIVVHPILNVGIDIEHITNKPYGLQNKFLNPNTELPFCKYNTIEEAHFFSTLFWSAKETVYKWYAKKNITLLQNIEIQDITTILKKYSCNSNIGSFEITCHCPISELPVQLTIFFKQIPDLQNCILTWCCA